MDIRELENMATQIQTLKNVQRLQQMQIQSLLQAFEQHTHPISKEINEAEDGNGAKWDHTEDDIVIFEFETAIRRAARKLGRSPNAIRSRLNKLRDIHRRMRGEW